MSHRQESVVERVGAVVDRGLRVVVGGGAVFHWIPEGVLTEGGSMWVLEDRGWCRSVAHKGWMGNCGVPRWRRKKGFLELNWLESRLEMVVQFRIQDRGWFSRRWCHVAFLEDRDWCLFILKCWCCFKRGVVRGRFGVSGGG